MLKSRCSIFRKGRPVAQTGAASSGFISAVLCYTVPFWADVFALAAALQMLPRYAAPASADCQMYKSAFSRDPTIRAAICEAKLLLRWPAVSWGFWHSWPTVTSSEAVIEQDFHTQFASDCRASGMFSWWMWRWQDLFGSAWQFYWHHRWLWHVWLPSCRLLHYADAGLPLGRWCEHPLLALVYFLQQRSINEISLWHFSHHWIFNWPRQQGRWGGRAALWSAAASVTDGNRVSAAGNHCVTSCSYRIRAYCSCSVSGPILGFDSPHLPPCPPPVPHDICQENYYEMYTKICDILLNDLRKLF